MKTALLCVSFGTSVSAARKNITAVEDALRQEIPQADFFRAFTSKTIRGILAKKGELLWSADEALEHLTDGRYDQVVVQPTHFLYGLEYESLKASVEVARKRFPALLLGKPLLSGTQDLQTLAKILMKEYPQKEGSALVFMGHGTPHFSNVVYPAMQTVFHMMGRKDVYVRHCDGLAGDRGDLRSAENGGIFPCAHGTPDVGGWRPCPQRYGRGGRGQLEKRPHPGGL